MRKLLKQTLALATSVAMCLSVASPVLTAYADDTTAPTADSYVDAGDTADVRPFGSIAAPETAGPVEKRMIDYFHSSGQTAPV